MNFVEIWFGVFFFVSSSFRFTLKSKNEHTQKFCARSAYRQTQCNCINETKKISLLITASSFIDDDEAFWLQSIVFPFPRSRFFCRSSSITQENQKGAENEFFFLSRFCWTVQFMCFQTADKPFSMRKTGFDWFYIWNWLCFDWHNFQSITWWNEFKTTSFEWKYAHHVVIVVIIFVNWIVIDDK